MTLQSVEFPLGPPAQIHPSLLSARSAVLGAVAGLLAVPDRALTRPWRWGGKDSDVRYGFYHLYEVLEEAGVEAAAAVERGGVHRAEAGAILAQATAARWDLRGLMLPLRPSDVNREPGAGEWTIRRTLEHLISAQFSYAFRTAYAVQRARSVRSDLPVVAPEEAAPAVLAGMKSGGTLALVQRRLEEASDTGAEALSLLDEALDIGIGLLQHVDRAEELDAPTTWSVYEVSARFRLYRWSSHLREHTIQVEKTLVLLGLCATEVERLARLILDAFGRLEGLALGVPEESVPARTFENAAQTVRGHAQEIRAAAA